MNSLMIWRQIDRPRLLVLGDLILDRYTWGVAERVSPEAPVIVLLEDSNEIRCGGAASVAALLRGLEADVSIAGVVGDDSDGRTLLHLLADDRIGISSVLIDPGRRTTSKERFVGRASGRHEHQILRVDREQRSTISSGLANRLLRTILPRLNTFQAVLISDYGKGVCVKEVIGPLIAAANELNIPVVVDPARDADYSQYVGASLIKPNRIEASKASGMLIATPDEARVAGEQLCSRFGFAAVLITLDQQGMVLVEAGCQSLSFSTAPREVYDITGAGDMVLAVLGLGLASGLSVADVVPLANFAAGLEVSRFGVSKVSRRELTQTLELDTARSSQHKILRRTKVAEIVNDYRQAGKQIVFTNGCFDLLHVGHLHVLEQAAAQGDILIVGLNADASIRRLKGASRPIIPERDRVQMVSSLECVDHVIVFGEDTPRELIEQIRPDVLVKGNGCAPEEIVGRAIVEEQGGRVFVATMIPGVSTTSLEDAIRQRENIESAK